MTSNNTTTAADSSSSKKAPVVTRAEAIEARVLALRRASAKQAAKHARRLERAARALEAIDEAMHAAMAREFGEDYHEEAEEGRARFAPCGSIGEQQMDGIDLIELPGVADAAALGAAVLAEALPLAAEEKA